MAVAEDTTALAKAIERERPDVVLTDIFMPPFDGAEGIHVAARLRESHPEIGVVILSQYAEPGYALELLEAGLGRARLPAEGARRQPRGAVAAIQAVASRRLGDRPEDRRHADRGALAQRPTRSSAASPSREREVLAEVATGKSNSAIADSLFLTKRAVEKHINAIFMKLNLRDSEDVSRRVKATLIYLTEEGGGAQRRGGNAPSPPAAA